VLRRLTAEERGARLREAKARLRKLRLLSSLNPADPLAVDAHPVVRAFFATWLEKHAPEGARAAHEKLFRHYAAAAPEFPSTLAEMEPLFHAVAHGVRAGCVAEVFDTVYWNRISRGNEHYIIARLGTHGAHLATLHNFFELAWTRPHQSLTPEDRMLTLSGASYSLAAVGRLREAVPPREASLASVVEAKSWRNASNIGEVLSILLLVTGDVARAVEIAEQALDHANRSQDHERIASAHGYLAEALACAGQIDDALAHFDEAEKDPEVGILVLGNLWHGTLLIEQGMAAQALDRGNLALDYFTHESGWLAQGSTLLLFGRAQEALRDDGASDSLDAAVEKLRKAGDVIFLPLGLLGRAAHRRRRVAAGEAALLTGLRQDLDEVAEICDPEMRLYLADLALERARAALDIPTAFKDSRQEAERQIKAAGELIAETGYHRRDAALADLHARLAELERGPG
jgi:tetratricopeptide (TPR) repeat protein